MPSATKLGASMHALTTADLFRSTWPRHTAKHTARAAGSPVATAKAWVQARFTPSANTLLRMIQEDNELRAELFRRLGGHGYGDAAAKDRGLGTATAGGAAGTAGGPDRPAHEGGR